MTITLERFRRFEERTVIDVAGDIVALVGPNEAGKSSILDAMVLLNDREPYADRDRTRGNPEPPLIIAGYVLDDKDRKAIEDIRGGGEVQWWTLEKRPDGNFNYGLHPRPTRDLQDRHAQAEALRHFEEDGEVDRLIKGIGSDTANQYQRATKALESEAETLGLEQYQAIRQFGKLYESRTPLDPEDEDDPDDPEGVALNFHEFLQALTVYDEGSHPHHEAALRLIERRPRFLLFSEEDRALESSYDLSEAIDDVPEALANVARLGNLSLPSLLDAINTSNAGRRATLIGNANDELKRVFKASWRQSDVTVHFDTDNTVLDILASLPGGEYTDIDERSAGLRSFVALRAFIETVNPQEPPILLIDEAEMHLHYDAQADLINVFAEQRYAAKVIYSTHSAGCLPRDLGNGIRAVAPSRTSNRSTVHNSVWAGKDAGVSPVVFAMGATTFAFLPARNVLLAEGESDAMLYPTLFREAARTSSLPFQVAPGLASVSPSQLPNLSSEGGKVVFLADGDEEGGRYRGELEAAGIAIDHIFDLRTEFGDAIELEDLIEPTHYAAAVNDVIRAFQRPKNVFAPEDIGLAGRATTLAGWCTSHSLKCPDKTLVAQRLLEMKSEAARQAKELQLLEESRVEQIAALLGRIEIVLAPTPKRKRSKNQ